MTPMTHIARVPLEPKLWRRITRLAMKESDRIGTRVTAAEWIRVAIEQRLEREKGGKA